MGRPPRWAESVVAVLIPPACREEILGDLYERYRSPGQYLLSALSIIPFVVLSRIRRGWDAPLVLMEAVCIYAGFLAASLITRSGTDAGLLAMPAVIALIATHIADVYTKAGAPAIGVAIAVSASYRWLPRADLLIGCGLALMLCTAARYVLIRAPGELRGVRIPSAWLRAEPGQPFNRKQIAGILLCLVLAIVLKLLTRK